MGQIQDQAHSFLTAEQNKTALRNERMIIMQMNKHVDISLDDSWRYRLAVKFDMPSDHEAMSTNISQEERAQAQRPD